MIGNSDFLCDLKLTPNASYVTYGKNTNSHIRGYGIHTNDNFFVSNIALVIDLKHNLISVAQLTDAN